MPSIRGFFVSFLFCSVVGYAQMDTIQAHRYATKADSLLDQGKYKQSVNLLNNAAIVFKNNGIWDRYVQIQNQLALTLYYQKEFDISLEILNETLKICKEKLNERSPEAAKTMNKIGLLYTAKGENDKALVVYKKALSICKEHQKKSDLNIASLYMNMGIAYDQLGHIDPALTCYETSVEINQLLYKENKKNELSSAYLNLAVLYSRNGLYHQATSLYKDVIQLDKELYGNQHPYLAEDYYNLGSNYSYIGEHYLALRFYEEAVAILLQIDGNNEKMLGLFYQGIGTQHSKLGNNALALQNYQKVLEIYKVLYKENHKNVADILRNIGGVYVLTKEYDKAAEFLEKSYIMTEDLFGQYHRNMVPVYKELGLLHKNQGQYQLANSYYQKALDITLQEGGRKNQKTSECYASMAAIHMAEKKYTQAVKEYQEAIISGTLEFDNHSEQALPDADDFINAKTLLVSVFGKASALQLRGIQNNNRQDLELALLSFRLCDALIEKTRKAYIAVEDKLLFGDMSTKVYEQALATVYALYQQTRSEQYLSDAFFFSEKKRARLLEEQIRKVAAENFVEIPNDKLKKIETIGEKLAMYQSKLHEIKNQPSAIDSSKQETIYSNAIFNLVHQQDSLIKVLEQQYPKYHDLKYNGSMMSYQEVQKRVPTKTVILEYFVNDADVYVLVLSRHNFEIKKLTVTNLDQKVTTWNATITNNDMDGYQKVAYQLYQDLLEPLQLDQQVENLILVPDGVLWHLNFDTLLTQNTNSTQYKELPYLVKEHVISYANSINLFFKNNKRRKEAVTQCLAFSFANLSDVDSSSSTSMALLRDTDDDLPGAREEIKAISTIMEGIYFFGEEASEDNFKKYANQYSIIHLALHGELDHQNPENSRLFFTKGKDTIQDNYLYNHELYALDIPAEMIVLSACNTGTGKVSNGEGIMSLGRAFQYAGTQSLVLTNWEVADETTPELMKNFYSNLKKGMTKPKALQQAKLQYIESANVYQNTPFYWGGFYVIGDTSAINFENSYTMLIYCSIGGLLLLGGAILGYRKRKKIKV